MNAYASPAQGFGRAVEDLFSSVESESRQAAAYFEHVVVPQVRRESGMALRLLAGHLERLADYVDPAGKQRQ